MFTKKLAVGIFTAVLLLSTPLSTHAQTVEDFQAQIASLLAMVANLQQQLAQVAGIQPTTTVPIIITDSRPLTGCVNITNNLWFERRDRDTSGEVSKLQQFLKDEGVYQGLVGGYFGPATELAVQSWQRKHGVVSSGTPDSSGYGVVGPTTRSKMRCIIGYGTDYNNSTF